MPNEEKREFTFISEQIKKKPLYRKKWFIYSMAGIGLAILFGSTAGVTFAVVKPWAEKQFGDPETPNSIVINQEEPETETQIQEETGETQEQEGAQEPETVVEKKELELSDYESLYQKLYQVGDSAMDSVVTVIAQSSDMGWTNELDESQVQASGLIFAKNSQNYYILTETSVLTGADQIVVRFCDGASANAAIQKEDSVTGTAVVTVSVADVQKKTKDAISTAELGSSLNVRQGTPVISLGSSQTSGSSMAFGMITSVTDTAAVDSEYTVLTTDIIGSAQSSGVLVDLDGNIIGIISRNVGQSMYAGTITALGISDMKYMMEAMSNNKAIPYLGITGYEISETVSRQNTVPRGLYISEVDADSPAMYAGLQVGIDILTEIQGEEIRTMEDYVTELRKYNPGQTLRLKVKRRGIDGYVDLEVEVTLDYK